MTDFARETLFDVVEEIAPLLQQHYEELTLNKDRIALNPMWDEYRVLESIGRFVIFTARDEGKLVGYAAFFVNRHLHYADTVLAANDVLYLHPALRDQRIGAQLIGYAESQLRELGAHKITWHAKYSNHLAEVLRKMGYQDEEIVLGKML